MLDDIEKRRTALALWRAHGEAEEKTESVMFEAPPEVRRAAVEMQARFEDELAAIEDRQARELDEMFRRDISGYAAAADARDAALKAYNDFDAPDIETDEAGEPRICALTGAPAWVGESMLFDTETGEMFLRAVSGLPPAKQTTE